MDRDPGHRDADLYEDDYYAWTQVQAAKLRHAAEARVNLDLDLANLAEEVEDLGKAEHNAVSSAVYRVLEHLLKLEHSPADGPRRGWAETVLEHRERIRRRIDDSPSLRPKLAAMLDREWQGARRKAAFGLEQDGVPESDLPAECPYTLDQILEYRWFPANRHGLP